MKKFEYKIVSVNRNVNSTKKVIDIDETETMLLGEGLIGWEVISTFQNAINGKSQLCFLMKREISQNINE